MFVNGERVPTQIVLNGAWRFAFLPEWDSAEKKLPRDEEFCASLAVPAIWDDCIGTLRASELWRSIRFNPSEPRPMRWPATTSPPDQSLPFIVGTGFYKQTIAVPEDWNGNVVSLHVGGVRLEAWVWVNGIFLGYHLGHSTPFEIAIEKALKLGAQNEIVIAVSNKRNDRSGTALRGYAGRSGGIYRGVHLQVACGARIKALYVRPGLRGATIRWNVSLVRHSASNDTLGARWRIRQRISGDILGEGICETDCDSLEWESDRFGIQAWSDRNPTLYDLEIELMSGVRLLDRHVQVFGYREFQRAGAHLHLNGLPVYLRGLTEQCYFPLTCTAPTDVLSYRENLRRLKELGFNWLRFHTWVPSHEYMQAADELGILIQVELPVGAQLDEWRDIVRNCRIHPSVVLYCAGNEATLDEAKIEFVRKLSSIQHEIASDALFSPMEALAGVEYGNMGAPVVSEPFVHNPARLAALMEFSDVLESYTPEASYSSVRGEWRALEKRMQLYRRPVLAHEICIHGNYLNIDLEQRYAGTRIGTDLYAATREHLAENGLLDKAPLYYHNSCAFMRVQRKHATETIRKCASISGYDMLGAVDQHWHRSGYPCGIMNEFYELKPGETAADVRCYNHESVLLLDCSTIRNIRSGQGLEFDVLVSLFGSGPLDAGTLSWVLRDSAEVLAAGQLNSVRAENGSVSKIGTVRFIAPSVSAARTVSLQLHLTSSTYDMANEWTFWIFPNSKISSSQSSAKWVTSLNKQSCKDLENGSDLVLLGTHPFPSTEIWFQSSSSGRAGGHKGAIIHDHPLMNEFPHETFLDWQFFSMFDTHARAAIFDQPDMPFSPIVELISPFKRIRKMAVLFEYQVGRGRLLVCALNLNNSDPGAVFLRQEMNRYVLSNRFRPKATLAPDALGRLLAQCSKAEGLLETDQGRDVNVA